MTWTKKTGEIINIFGHAAEAEQKLRLRDGAQRKILECVSGRLGSYLGYRWET